MDGGKIIMAHIFLKDGLLYIDLHLKHGDKTATIKNALIDTGSVSTVISREIITNKLGLKPQPNDLINSVQGIGGSETVIEKVIDFISIDNTVIPKFHFQMGAMDYSLELEAIIGLDLLIACKAILDLNNLKLHTG